MEAWFLCFPPFTLLSSACFRITSNNVQKVFFGLMFGGFMRSDNVYNLRQQHRSMEIAAYFSFPDDCWTTVQFMLSISSESFERNCWQSLLSALSTTIHQIQLRYYEGRFILAIRCSSQGFFQHTQKHARWQNVCDLTCELLWILFKALYLLIECRYKR